MNAALRCLVPIHRWVETFTSSVCVLQTCRQANWKRLLSIFHCRITPPFILSLLGAPCSLVPHLLKAHEGLTNENTELSSPQVMTKVNACIGKHVAPSIFSIFADLSRGGKVHDLTACETADTLSVRFVRRMFRRDWGNRWGGWTHSNLNAAEVSMTQRSVCGYHTGWASRFLSCLCRDRELLHSWAGQPEVQQ